LLLLSHKRSIKGEWSLLSELVVIEVNLDHPTARFAVCGKRWPPVRRDCQSAVNFHGSSCT
jgi:hypothetical protein